VLTLAEEKIVFNFFGILTAEFVKWGTQFWRTTGLYTVFFAYVLFGDSAKTNTGNILLIERQISPTCFYDTMI